MKTYFSPFIPIRLQNKTLDENNNGQRDEQEAIHIFWINLKDPKLSGRLY